MGTVVGCIESEIARCEGGRKNPTVPSHVEESAKVFAQ